MRAKLETLSLAVLKDFAKDKGIKNITNMKKSELIDAIVEACEKEGTSETEAVKEEAVKEEPVKKEKTERTVRNDRRVYKSRTVRDDKPQQNEENGYSGAASGTADTQQISEDEKYKKRQEILEQNIVIDPNPASGIIEVMPDGYGFIRCANFLPGENDVYVSPTQIRRYGLKTGDIIYGKKRLKTQGEKFAALHDVDSVNGYDPDTIINRPNFENLTPIFPNERIYLEKGNPTIAMRIVDLICPIGKGQRGMIVSQPKAGKTTLLKQIATAVLNSNPEMHMIILLIDERPEEVTDIKESIVGDNVEVIYSTFDELPERHKRVSEMVIERARRLVEHGKDVIILLDSITRLTRAYNVTVQASGRTLSGGLDPVALHMPKRFFGAARNMREGGSITVLATALIETGSKMDDVVFEEFKGTGNMELVLDRKLSEKRVFPAIDIAKSSTRRDDLLLSKEEMEAVDIIRKNLNGMKPDEIVDRVIDIFSKTKNNQEFIQYVKKTHF
jgi:transcription termination factor Rho